MTETIERLVERLRSEGQKTEEFFRSLTGSQLDRQLYADGSRWTVRQLLAHFVTAETGFLKLIENILAGGSGAAQDFDIDAYNEKYVSRLKDAALDDLLAQFARQRLTSIHLVEKMQPEDLEKTGRHPFLGVAPVEDILKLLYRHNQIHQRDVRKLLAEEAD
jgi:uncharacterized damage-inducible protein DinB